MFQSQFFVSERIYASQTIVVQRAAIHSITLQYLAKIPMTVRTTAVIATIIQSILKLRRINRSICIFAGGFEGESSSGVLALREPPPLSAATAVMTLTSSLAVSVVRDDVRRDAQTKVREAAYGRMLAAEAPLAASGSAPLRAHVSSLPLARSECRLVVSLSCLLV